MSQEDNSSTPQGRRLTTSWLYYVGQYLSAIYYGWVSLMSGVAGVVLLVLLVFWGDQYTYLKDNKKTFVWMAFICLIVAGFSAWRKERQRWERLAGSTVCSLTPEELVKVFDGRTTAQGDALAKNYIGKWIKVSGSIDDVTTASRRRVTNVNLETDAPYIILIFRGKAADSLSMLRKGDIISVFGRIDLIARDAVRLESCELLEIGTGETDKRGENNG